MYPLADFNDSSSVGFFSDLLKLYAGASIVEIRAGPCEDKEFARRIANLSRNLSLTMPSDPADRHSPSASKPENAVAAATRKSNGLGTSSDIATGNAASAPRPPWTNSCAC